MEILIWLAIIAAALFALDQLFLWMERRGWLYWRKKKSTSGASDLLTGFNFMDPGTRHLEEARQEHIQEDEDNGDDDSQRKSDDRIT